MCAYRASAAVHTVGTMSSMLTENRSATFPACAPYSSMLADGFPIAQLAESFYSPVNTEGSSSTVTTLGLGPIVDAVVSGNTTTRFGGLVAFCFGSVFRLRQRLHFLNHLRDPRDVCAFGVVLGQRELGAEEVGERGLMRHVGVFRCGLWLFF